MASAEEADNLESLASKIVCRINCIINMGCGVSTHPARDEANMLFAEIKEMLAAAAATANTTAASGTHRSRRLC